MSSGLHIALAMTALALTFLQIPLLREPSRNLSLPLPGIGYVAEEKDGFRYFPEATKWISNKMRTE
jgi:hypothetical protein